MFHPNCRHLKRIYIPDKTVPNNPPNYDPKKVAVNYELEQIQRRLEREIRNKKRVLEMSLTDEKRAKAQASIRDKQAQLRGLVKFADKNGYKVYRQNWKEQIDFEKQPTVPYKLPDEIAKKIDVTLKTEYNKSDVARGAETIVKINGKQYSKEYVEKLTETYYKFKDEGVQMGDHALNRFIGQKQGRDKKPFTFDDVLYSYRQPANYTQPDGRAIHYYNNVMVVLDPKTSEVITVNYYKEAMKSWKKL